MQGPEGTAREHTGLFTKTLIMVPAAWCLSAVAATAIHACVKHYLIIISRHSSRSASPHHPAAPSQSEQLRPHNSGEMNGNERRCIYRPRAAGGLTRRAASSIGPQRESRTEHPGMNERTEEKKSALKNIHGGTEGRCQFQFRRSAGGMQRLVHVVLALLMLLPFPSPDTIYLSHIVLLSPPRHTHTAP